MQRVVPVELTQAALQSISALNPRLNAFITVVRIGQHCRQSGRAEMMSGHRGPCMHPIALKDPAPLRTYHCGQRFSMIDPNG